MKTVRPQYFEREPGPYPFGESPIAEGGEVTSCWVHPDALIHVIGEAVVARIPHEQPAFSSRRSRRCTAVSCSGRYRSTVPETGSGSCGSGEIDEAVSSWTLFSIAALFSRKAARLKESSQLIGRPTLGRRLFSSLVMTQRFHGT